MKSFINSRTNQLANLPICQFANLPIQKSSTLIVFLLSLSFLVSTNSFAQEIEWQKTIGGSGWEELKSICISEDGGVLLAGYSNSNISGNKAENCIGQQDYWIVKVDSLGNILWQNTIGGSHIDYLSTVDNTTDGGYILGGWSSSNYSGDKTENSNGNADYWIVKINSLGLIQWQNTIGGSGGEELYSIQQTTDGGYILGGISSSIISGDKTEWFYGYHDYWIIKTDSLGNIMWQNTIGGDERDNLRKIIQTSDGGYLVGGYSASSMLYDKTEGSMGSMDYWIVKTDALGNIIWQNTIGGNKDDNFEDVQQTVDGGYILGGWSYSDLSGDKTEACLGDADIWIVKTDSIGNIQWQKTIGGKGHENFKSIIQTNDGGFLLGAMVCCINSVPGITYDVTETLQGNGFDLWCVKLTSGGSILWHNLIGGFLSESPGLVAETDNGEIVVSGHTNSNFSGDKSENCFGGYDYWILKLTEKYNLISGKLYADLNGNGIQDVGELPIAAKKIVEQNTNRFAFTDHIGQYTIAVVDSGTFTVAPQSVNRFNPIPSSHPAAFTGILQTDSLNDFALQPQGTYEDVCITITPMGNFRSGFDASYMINYGNYGNTTVAPTVYFYPYNNVAFQSATLTPNNVTPDSVVWNLPALSPFQTGSILVTVNVNLGLPIGTLINSSAHIEPYLTDDNPSCNNSNWEVNTAGSFDPNDILVSEDTLTTTQLSTAPWLDYIIRFQNTGNDTAFNVKILNPIDTFKLNLSTIEFVNASHPINLNWINYQRNMEFKFENILLVDSNTNEPLSHGFVRYRIQPKTSLISGDIVKNSAAILFDFNDPVVTNEARTLIVSTTGLSVSSREVGKLLVFPNPADNKINITNILLENGKSQLRLTDLYGKLLNETSVTTITIEISIVDLPAGVYFLQMGDRRASFIKN